MLLGGFVLLITVAISLYLPELRTSVYYKIIICHNVSLMVASFTWGTTNLLPSISYSACVFLSKYQDFMTWGNTERIIANSSWTTRNQKHENFWSTPPTSLFFNACTQFHPFCCQYDQPRLSIGRQERSQAILDFLRWGPGCMCVLVQVTDCGPSTPTNLSFFKCSVEGPEGG